MKNEVVGFIVKEEHKESAKILCDTLNSGWWSRCAEDNIKKFGWCFAKKNYDDGTSIQECFENVGLLNHWFTPVYKKEPTREEITAKWVKDNGVKVGDKVRVTVDKPFMSKGTIYKVKEINSYCITCEGYAEECDFNVEDIEKVTSKIVKFTFDDRDLFRDKWVILHEKIEARIFAITEDKINFAGVGFFSCMSYSEAFEKVKFIDGTPFGKEVWE